MARFGNPEKKVIWQAKRRHPAKSVSGIDEILSAELISSAR
jgi:hypothetical protein